MGKRCIDLSQGLQQRLDQLNRSTQSCVLSAQQAEQEIKRGMDRIRATVAQKEQQLLAEVKQLQQVLYCTVLRGVWPN